MINENKITDINLALKLIKNGEILISKINNSLIYFALKKDKIYCQSSNSSYLISINEFLDLYNQTNFYIYNYDENDIDPKKDEEYYNWNFLTK